MSDHQNRSGALLQNPDKISSYFKNQWPVLLVVTITGLVYNIGQAIGPWFEGQLTQCLADIISGTDTFSSMVKLAFGYLILIGIVQGTRFLKRLYVRKFSNNINRSMKQVLYANLIRQSKTELETAGTGNVMTKAISDVDACAEGMRKFTTEIFDTGIALLAYGILLFSYDWRLAILSLLFVPLCYFIAEKMKTVVQRTGAANKESAGRLNAATLDRISGAVTYRVYGCELQRDQDYEEKLSDYEKSAVRAGIPTAAMPPIYTVISTAGVVFIFIFGSRNVLGTGWTVWNIAAFTAFLSCFTKVATKASRAAKLFNAVHKAQVSWKRIKSLMHTPKPLSDVPKAEAKEIRAVDLSISYKGYQGGEKVLHDIEFTVAPGSIIGITGAVACGKSTLGRAFLCETPYKGSITYGGKEFSELSEDERCGIVGYLGHKPELLSDTIARNILMGDSGDVHEYLRAVCMDEEVNSITEDINTRVGDGGVRLSGGQQQRIALARTLAHLRPLLVLDDPFSALDRATELEIFENLKKMAKGSTIFLISHRLYLFPEMDGVIWMENGTGMLSNHEILMETVPQYAALYKAQESEEKTEGVQSNENKSSLG